MFNETGEASGFKKNKTNIFCFKLNSKTEIKFNQNEVAAINK